MCFTRILAIPALILLLLGTLSAQSEMPISLSVYNESVSMPFTNWWSDPIHPGIELGTEFRRNSDRKLQVYPGIKLGYLFHRKLFQGAYARVDIGFDYRHRSGISLKAKLGAGYLRTFSVRTEYRLEDGQLRALPDKGNHRIMPSLSWGLGYRLRPRDPRSTELFVLHETWIEYPYAGDFIPLIAHTNMHLGAIFYPFLSQKNR